MKRQMREGKMEGLGKGWMKRRTDILYFIVAFKLQGSKEVLICSTKVLHFCKSN